MKDQLRQLAMQLKASTPTDAQIYSSLQRAGILDSENNFTEPYKHLEMGKQKLDILQSTRISIFSELKGHCYVSKDHDYIEVTEWSNGDGFDIDLSTGSGGKLSITWGQYQLLKKLVKQLEKAYAQTLTAPPLER